LSAKKADLEQELKKLSFEYATHSIDLDTYEKTKANLDAKIKELKAQINAVIDKILIFEKQENIDREMKNIELKIKIDQLQREKADIEKKYKDLREYLSNILGENRFEIPTKELDRLRHQNKYYRIILEEYRNYINSQNAISKEEIIEKVKPNHPIIKKIIDDLSPLVYVKEKDGLNVAKKFYNYVVNYFYPVENDLEISFWMDFEKMHENRLGDYLDLSLFLCSGLIRLGYDANVHIVQLDNGKFHSFVTFYDKIYYLLDPFQKEDFNKYSGENFGQLLLRYRINGHYIKRKVFTFSDKEFKEE